MHRTFLCAGAGTRIAECELPGQGQEYKRDDRKQIKEHVATKKVMQQKKRKQKQRINDGE